MAKIALITDTHYGARNDNSVLYEYFKKSNQYFIDLIQKEKPDYVVHLGDLFDRRKYINFVTAQRCRTDLLEPLQALGLPVHIIAGNHDIFYKNSILPNSLREIVGKRYSNIHIHDEHAHPLEGVILQPWLLEGKSPPPHKYNILLGHFDITGFEMYKGSISEHGLNPNDLNFDAVLTGHYHHKSSNKNIHYIGAAYEIIWSDYKDPRGFSFFDTQTLDLTFHQNPYTVFETFVYDEANLPQIQAMLQDENASTQFEGKYIKVIVKDRTNSFIFDTFTDRLLDAGPVDVSIVDDVMAFTDSEEEVINQAEDTSTILNKYIDGIETKLDSKRVKSLMQDLYKEAVTLDTE